jgi:AcrR family transcriptional regulator
MLGTGPPKRETYRHGDLRRALVGAGVELARTGGPDAVVLREATRRVGVAPNAAYRHFADRQALLESVCWASWAQLARGMEDELASLVTGADLASAARIRLCALGAGYLRFAQTEPGLFRTAFAVPADLDRANNPELAGKAGQTPFQMLARALDDLVKTGVLASERRRGAEYLVWSTVHGLAMLLVDGPLRGLDTLRKVSIKQRVLDMIDQGLHSLPRALDDLYIGKAVLGH